MKLKNIIITLGLFFSIFLISCNTFNNSSAAIVNEHDYGITEKYKLEASSTGDSYLLTLNASNIENNELKYTIKHVNNQAKLEVGVEARCNDKKAEDEAIEKAKSLLTKYGISKDQIPVQVDHGVCKAYEDYVDSNGHGNQHLSQ